MYSTISHIVVLYCRCAKQQATRRVGRSCPTLELSLGKTKSDEGTVKRTKKQKRMKKGIRTENGDDNQTQH